MLNQRAQERNRCKLGRNGQHTTKNGNIYVPLEPLYNWTL